MKRVGLSFLVLFFTPSTITRREQRHVADPLTLSRVYLSVVLSICLCLSLSVSVSVSLSLPLHLYLSLNLVRLVSTFFHLTISLLFYLSLRVVVSLLFIPIPFLVIVLRFSPPFSFSSFSHALSNSTALTGAPTLGLKKTQINSKFFYRIALLFFFITNKNYFWLQAITAYCFRMDHLVLKFLQ